MELFLTTLATFLILILTAIYIYMKYTYSYWSRKHVPYLQPIFPFGSAKDIFFQKESFGDFFTNIYFELKKKTKIAGGYYYFCKPILLLIDPEMVKPIFIKNFANFHDRDIYVDEENDPLSLHLVGLRGAKWKELRAKLTPTFTSGKIKMMFHTMKDCTNDLEEIIKDYIDKREAIDIKDLFTRLTIDSIVNCAFGIDCNSVKNTENNFRIYGKKSSHFGFKDTVINAFAMNYPWILKLLKLPVTSPDISRFFIDTLRRVVEYREKNKIYRKDFLELLIQLKNNKTILDATVRTPDEISEAGLTFNELVAQAFVFFAAGFETTSSTLTFCMFELVSNPEIQQKLRNEIRHVLRDYNGVLSYNAVMSMTYMDKVVNETLRKFPPIPRLNRQCTREFQIPEMNYTIEKGSTVFLPILGLQRDEKYYPNPDHFDPERFSDEEKVKRHPFTFMPFGVGPRHCIGMRFGLLQVKLVLSVLLERFQFTLDPKTITPLYFSPQSVFLAPKDNIWLQAQFAEDQN